MYWDEERIQKQRDYFFKERIEKKGNFTEFVVRTYYCIYKACILNDGISCPASAVSPHKLKFIIYKDIYDTPDHGYKEVIDDCIKKLKLMKYIKFRKENDKWMICLNRALDFLLPNEHELYLEKYLINNINSLKSEINTSNDTFVDCMECRGQYKINEGKYGIFAGCSNYPSCKSTLDLATFVLRYIQKNGINIYRWNKECYKCKRYTQVYSYYLDYVLEEIEGFSDVTSPTVGLGDISYVDELLSREIPSIQMRYSNTVQSTYMANTCQHCRSLQGRNYVVEDPHEILEELWHDRGMEKFFYKNLKIKNVAVLEQDIKHLFTQLH